jgi:hypothetical protein
LVRTTRSNYNSFREKILWTNLPSTFRDAIRIAASLGIDFIWIDSLCIIQNDPDDWAKQASEMAMIYDNAYITLCATGAKDGATGLFLDRTGVHTIAGTHDTIPYTVYVRQMLCHATFEIAIDAKDVASTAKNRGYRPRDLPGQTRGWIAQEQLISRRVVHFTQEELMWDCREDVACECTSIKEHMFGALSFKQFALAGLHDIDRAWSSWYQILEDFVVRDFKYDSDRLPALSGLAQRFEESAGANLGTYCAGLWGSNFPRGLMWETARPGKRCFDTERKGLMSSPPSWSWAGMKPMSLSWPLSLASDDIQINVFNVRTYPSTADPKGMVNGGYVLLEGRLLPLCVSWSDMKPSEVNSRNSGGDKNYLFTLLREGDDPPKRLQNHGQIKPDVDLADDGLIPGQTVFFLHVVDPPRFGTLATDAPRGLFLVETDRVVNNQVFEVDLQADLQVSFLIKFNSY